MKNNIIKILKLIPSVLSVAIFLILFFKGPHAFPRQYFPLLDLIILTCIYQIINATIKFLILKTSNRNLSYAWVIMILFGIYILFIEPGIGEWKISLQLILFLIIYVIAFIITTIKLIIEYKKGGNQHEKNI